jgi:PHP family Zn ribbon phosphoesterase
MTEVLNTEGLRIFKAELHIHTVLSPCASVEMIPPLIVQEALNKGIDIIAISDHNTTGNIESVMKAADQTEVTVLPGMELHTREDVHVLCLFPDLDAAQEFQKIVDAHLPSGDHQAVVWGPQYLVDSTGSMICEEKRILNMATKLTIDRAEPIVHELGGLFIPAHIQRKLYGILPVLGFLPLEIAFDALEIPCNIDQEKINRQNPDTRNFPILQNGDAHYLEDIMGVNQMLLQSPELNEIRLALQRIEGRKIVSY